MIIVGFRLDHPILRQALNQVPELEITWERTDTIDDGRVRLLIWAEGGDLEAFEDALTDDPTVVSSSHVTHVGDRRLYQIEQSDEGWRTSIYPLMVEEGAMIQDLKATHDGWEFRAAFSDRASFNRLYELCQEREIEFEFYRLYDEREDADVPRYGLTNRQRETLIAAIDHGFFEIPRECTLAELGEYLDISETAASERLRRAMRTLIGETVYPNPSELR